MSDKQRMDFLEAQGYTRWAGYGTQHRNCVWPVFAGDSFRDAVDHAMRAAKRDHEIETAKAPLDPDTDEA